jgi:hypothetical protein
MPTPIRDEQLVPLVGLGRATERLILAGERQAVRLPYNGCDLRGTTTSAPSPR